MSRFHPFLALVIGCIVVASSGFLPQHAYSQSGGAASGRGESYGQSYGGGSYAAESAPPSDDERFQRGIRRVVKSLEQAETKEEKKRLLELGRKGLEWQYQRKLDARKTELEKLRRQLEQLETDYERRVQAMQRIVDLQLESLELASEGLINLEDVIRRGRRSGEYGMEGYGSDMEGYADYGSGMEASYGSDYGSGMEESYGIPAYRPIKPGEDPFEGLGGEKNESGEDPFEGIGSEKNESAEDPFGGLGGEKNEPAGSEDEGTE